MSGQSHASHHESGAEHIKTPDSNPGFGLVAIAFFAALLMFFSINDMGMALA